MLKQRGVRRRQETFTKEHLKNNSRISVENAFKETTDKNLIWLEQRGFIVSAFGFAPVAGSSPLAL
jgi:hypothetical protein